MSEDRLSLARKYIGLEEVKDNSKLKKLLGIDPATTAWCAAFVNAIEREAGGLGTGKLTARSFLKWGKKISNPTEGCIVVLRRGNSSWQGHVAFFVSEDDNNVFLLGGNQGNRVCIKAYPKKDVLGYRE